MTETAAINKIRKLFATANDTAASASEVESALKLAAQLLDKYHLEESQIAETEKYTPSNEFCDEVMNVNDSTYDWEKYLLHIIADCTMCTMIYAVTGKSYPYKQIRFIGRRIDVVTAHVLYEYLRPQIIRLSKGQSKRQDFCKGIVYGLKEKLAAYRKTVNALVPVGVEDYLKEKYPAIRSTRRRSYKPNESFLEGLHAAGNVNIHRPVSAPALPGSSRR